MREASSGEAEVNCNICAPLRCASGAVYVKSEENVKVYVPLDNFSNGLRNTLLKMFANTFNDFLLTLVESVSRAKAACSYTQPSFEMCSGQLTLTRHRSYMCAFAFSLLIFMF